MQPCLPRADLLGNDRHVQPPSWTGANIVEVANVTTQQLCLPCHQEPNDSSDKDQVVRCIRCFRILHCHCQKAGCIGLFDSKGVWYCSPQCSAIEAGLADLVSRTASSYESLENDYSYRVMRGTPGATTTDTSLNAALSTLEERLSVVLPDGRSLLKLLVENDLPSGGFYTIQLKSKRSIVSTLVTRIFGNSLAELPVAATREEHQGKGHAPRIVQLLVHLLGQLGVAELALPSCVKTKWWWRNRGFVRVSASRQLAMRATFPVQTYQDMTVMSIILDWEGNLVPWSVEALLAPQGQAGEHVFQLGVGLLWDQLVAEVFQLCTIEEATNLNENAVKPNNGAVYLALMLLTAVKYGITNHQTLETHFPGFVETIPGALNIEVPENAVPPGFLSPPSVNPAWAAQPQWQQAPVDAGAAAAHGDVGGASEARDPSEAGSAGSGDNQGGSPASVASAAGGILAEANVFLERNSPLSLCAEIVKFWNQPGRSPEEVLFSEPGIIKLKCTGHERIVPKEGGGVRMCGVQHEWKIKPKDVPIRNGKVKIVCPECSPFSPKAFCVCASVKASNFADQWSPSDNLLADRKPIDPASVPATSRSDRCTWVCRRHGEPFPSWMATPQAMYHGRSFCPLCGPPALPQGVIDMQIMM